MSTARPLIPGTPAQLSARRAAMSALVQMVAEAHASGRRSLEPTAVDNLAACFSVPVSIEVEWDTTCELGHPMIRIMTRRLGAAIIESLSTREREVAHLIVDGLTNRDIAERLGISVTTVKDHVHHVLARTGFRSRNALAAALRR
jgi:DNA-binding NarL/FixJ family response regulator